MANEASFFVIAKIHTNCHPMHQDISILGETLKLIHVSHLLYAAKDLTGYEDEHVKAHTINQDRLGKEYHFHAS